MNKHLETLEFPKVLDKLAQHATFAPGKELALRFRPSPHLAEVQSRQAETAEASRLLAEGCLNDPISGTPICWEGFPMVLPVSDALKARVFGAEYESAVQAELERLEGAAALEPSVP